MDEVILSRIRQEAYEQGYQDGKVDGYNLAGTRMSSAKQERRVGKWEIKWDIPCCSVCHKFSVLKTHYCGQCGAEMKGEE